MEYKAIETHYNGYRFRSRLEARWAVFFDHAHIKYEYEPEGFELDDGTKYLPDFYLPEYGYYVEVKPPRANAFDDILRASEFVGHGIDKLLILGNIPKKSSVDVYHFPVIYYNTFYKSCIMTLACIAPYDADFETYIIKLGISDFYAIDRYIQYILPQMWQHLMELLNGVHDKKLSERLNVASYADCIEGFTEEVEYLNSCYDAARQARFEYGEKG